tara:strand:- start:1663 stop:2547 length:885 start_codon:yes stop_codon:yes gene_type:complete
MKKLSSMPNSKVLFIGLGRMGFHMSSHLSKNKNIDLYVHNRTEVISKKWLKLFSGVNYHFNSDIKFDYVITCLKDDRALDIVVKKLIKARCFKKNTLLIDHSTISLDQVKKINNFASLNKFYFLDAPVTGGVEGAKNRSLSSMVGGSLSKLKKSEPILSLYCKNITHMGKIGSGQLTKFTNQILICGILYSISEAFSFSKINKLNQKKLYDAIKDGAAGSWQFINRYKTINKNKFNFGFSTELMEKDLRYVLKQSAHNKLDLKLTKNVHKRYKKLLSTKYKNQDTSSLVKSFLK